MTAPEDPLRRNTTSDPLLVPPVTPEAAASRHAMDRQLINPAGEPVGPVVPVVAGPSAPALAGQIKSVDDRRKINVAMLAAGIVAVFLFTLIVGYLVHNQRVRVDDLNSRLTAADTERARIDGIHRNATCGVITALQRTSSSAARNAWPTGTAGYDTFFASLAISSVQLNCDAG